MFSWCEWGIRFMAINMQKVARFEVVQHTAKTKFIEKRTVMFGRVMDSLNAETATRLDFTKIVPTKFHL